MTERPRPRIRLTDVRPQRPARPPIPVPEYYRDLIRKDPLFRPKGPSSDRKPVIRKAENKNPEKKKPVIRRARSPFIRKAK